MSETAGPYVPEDFMYSTKVASCEPQVRQNFMSKVYSLLSAQLLFTFAAALTVSRNEAIQSFVVTHTAVWWLMMATTVLTCVWLSLAPRAEDAQNDYDTAPLIDEENQFRSTSTPWYVLSRKGQLALLGVFTFAEAYTISLVTLVYDPDVVLRALVITAVIVVGVSLMAMSPRFLWVLESAATIQYWLAWALLLLIGIGISSMFFGLGSKMDLLYGWLGAIVFTVYLFIDTQMVFRKVYPDEEIRCAMMLYLDIINLFLSILRILNHSNNDD